MSLHQGPYFLFKCLNVELPKRFTTHNIDSPHYAGLCTGSAPAVDMLCSADEFHSGNPMADPHH